MKLGAAASHSVVPILIAGNHEGLSTFALPSRPVFAGLLGQDPRLTARFQIALLELILGDNPLMDDLCAILPRHRGIFGESICGARPGEDIQ